MNLGSEMHMKMKMTLLTAGALLSAAAAVPAGAATANRDANPTRTAASPTQDASLAVMQMAIQTTTQAAIQSAVQAALQYANQAPRPAAPREGQAVVAPLVPVTPTASGVAMANGTTAGLNGATPATSDVPPAANASGRSAKTLQAPDAAPSTVVTAAVPATPSAMAVMPSAPPAPSQPTWEMLPGDRSVRTALERWSSKAGWQLSWELAVDYPVAVRSAISGSFETAVEAVAQSLGRAEVPVKAIMYRGNRVLRIVAKGSE
jgi:hypothetical protein